MATPLNHNQRFALETARHLASNGAPIFLARPDDSPLGFRLPKDWQHTRPDPTVADRWSPGDALCMVTGVLVDVIDVDPRNGGDLTVLDGFLPHTYGTAATPSGGTHLLIACLGVAKGKPFKGVDLQAGTPEGEGRGFVFIAPTVRPSRVTGEIRPYTWTELPDVEILAVVGEDDTGADLLGLLEARETTQHNGGGSTYVGPAYQDLLPSLKEWADRETAHLVERWRVRFEDVVDWPDGQTDEDGRGWEALSYQFAWSLAMVAACPWSGLDEDDAAMLYDLILPEALAQDEKCRGKWDASLVEKAANHPVSPPPWDDFSAMVDASYADDGLPAIVDVTNDALALVWLETELGRGRLSGLFQRGDDLVHTPRIGQAGYIEPKDERDSDGPAQVRRIKPEELARRISHGYSVMKGRGARTRPSLFPLSSASQAMAALDLLPNLRLLRRTTHTPLVRADGTILDQKGYDDQSGTLYLPEPALAVPRVADNPSRDDVRMAGKMLLDMVADFPFVTPHDRANYLGALITPLIRSIVPPPYKLIAIGAPQRGSGKSLLAWIMRELHGGVLKSEFPSDNDELHKFVTSTLDATTGPVVQFDNVTGTLKSSPLEGLLTSSTWDNRLLGTNTILHLQNDRLWVVTGNNVRIGGDLERRTMWVTIDAQMEHPETRHEFRIPGLEGWVTKHRGELLHSMLTMVRSWVVAGRPTPRAPTSDSFGDWVAALRGILTHARLGDTVGVVGHEDSVQVRADPEDEEWGTFLQAAYRSFNTRSWTARELVDRVVLQNDFSDVAEQVALQVSDLPGDLAEKIERPYISRDAVSRSLGMWLGNREGKIIGGMAIRKAGVESKTRKWKVVLS
jgi:hypothetical protein